MREDKAVRLSGVELQGVADASGLAGVGLRGPADAGGLAGAELRGIANVRDLGGIPTGEGRAVAPGLLFRGGELSGATLEDKAVLSDRLGIACVIDLRCGWEREAKPDAQMAGITNLHIPFFDLDIVGIEYTEPSAGTKVVGRDVACDPGHFYRALPNPLTIGQMAKALDVVFSHAAIGSPVYMHCSGGKDRAGVLSLLVLTILGASREDILEDYLATNVYRDTIYDKTLARFMRFTDGDEARARELVESHRARSENLDAFYETIDAKYGSMASFVHDQLGFDEERIQRVRACCTVACAEGK